MTSRYSGYMGRVLMIDLSSQSCEDYPWSDNDREKYVGGKIMAAKILSDHLKGGEAAYSEDNWLVISTGPLTGTGAPSSARFNVSGLSPQTGILASSNCGGSFGIYLKKAGYDAVIIKGCCAEHTWLEISEDGVEFHDAKEIWGLNTSACQQKLQQLMPGKKFGQICIGPAGENLVRYAGIVSDERSAGRTGLGAALGWKNIKAITAAGNKLAPVHDKDKTRKWMKKWVKYLQAHPFTGEKMPQYGTANIVKPMQQNAQLATRNYAAGTFSEYEKVSGEALAEQYNIKNKGCISCPIRCARTVCIDGREVKGPELETLALLGGNLMNSDLRKILEWNLLLDELGMDTISTANTLAWAMEANEKGLWDNGLRFGEISSIAQTMEDIAYRRGIGAELAEGSKRLSEKYGGKDFAIHSKGLELAAYEPRRAVGQGLAYAVSNRGGCHINGGYPIIVEGLGLNAAPQSPKAKADLTVMLQNLLEALSAGGQCIFTSYGYFPSFLLKNPDGLAVKTVNTLLPHLGWGMRIINKFPLVLAFHLPVVHHTRMFEYALGMKMSFGRFLRLGERGYNLERSINCRFGISAEKDKLPQRLSCVPQDPGDPSTVVPLERMKKTYYKARGWDENGIPTKKTLKKLGIEE